MSSCIWYVSKYVTFPGKGVGGRGYLLMSEFAKYGYTSVLITSDSNQLADVPTLLSAYEMQIVDGVRTFWVRTIKYNAAKSFSRILSWLHFEWRLLLMPKSHIPKPHVIIVSSLSLLTILNGFLLRQRYKCRLIFEIRDIWPLTLTAEGGYTRSNPLVKLLGYIEKLGYLYSDAIVGTMPNLAEHVHNVVGPGRPVSCIPMGVDPSLLSDTTALSPSFEHKYIPSDKFIVAYVGSIGIANSLETLLKCASSMRDHPHIFFLIVGDGQLKADYLRDYGDLPNIGFAPKVPQQMVQSLLNRCDLLYFSVHQSEVWRYGQSLNKVVDYMLSAKPIVASYTGFPSMIDESGCGTFVPSGDVQSLRSAILSFFGSDKAHLADIGARGRRWILRNRRYSILAQDYLSIMFRIGM